ncbi:hypothetical protein RISK_001553 [Rhodopirellula islandica]|uniref:Uncharacterized protein n=1 Tax=Rhodopirellula islandica TaxID=595434 RepID=A0A0J1BIH2_RHOIS|nr:hypothetical protein RISK_001553 [Rhodopirellula islandica]
MKSHQFAFFNCQFNFFNELHSVGALTTLSRIRTTTAPPFPTRCINSPALPPSTLKAFHLTRQP